jgi:hypothetical protein
LHVQKKQIGPLFLDRFDRISAVRAFRHNLDAGLVCEERAHPLARQRLIVGNNHAQFHSLPLPFAA